MCENRAGLNEPQWCLKSFAYLNVFLTLRVIAAWRIFVFVLYNFVLTAHLCSACKEGSHLKKKNGRRNRDGMRDGEVLTCHASVGRWAKDRARANE